MKKILSLTLLMFVALVFVGCGGAVTLYTEAPTEAPTEAVTTVEGSEPTGDTTGVTGDVSTEEVTEAPTTEEVVTVPSDKVMQPGITSNEIVIWVGDEVEAFYQQKANEYIAQYNANPDYQYLYPHTIRVQGADTGTAASTFADDPEAGPDILTIAHDNLGKLLSGSSAIYPISYQPLLDQIEAQNTQSFIDVSRGESGGVVYNYGVPYEAQALILYYNTKYLTAEDVETWEGIWDVAKAMDVRATTVTGTDGFNNSFLVLSSYADTGEMPISIYRNGLFENTDLVNDGAISIMKWGQRFFSDPNGADQASDSGWEVDLDVDNELTLSVVGGAWHFASAQAALGENLGIAPLPTYTLTEDDVYGSVQAGTVMHSGTFADTKMFVMNKRSASLYYLEDLLLFLTNKSVQEESFIENGSLPAYKNAAAEFESMGGDDMLSQLAAAQIEMFNWGIPQPFGGDLRFNFYYYSKQGPEKLFYMLTDTDPDIVFDTDEKIIARLQEVENIWIYGNVEGE
jgi:maltose-binding protein MalE